MMACPIIVQPCLAVMIHQASRCVTVAAGMTAIANPLPLLGDKRTAVLRGQRDAIAELRLLGASTVDPLTEVESGYVAAESSWAEHRESMAWQSPEPTAVAASTVVAGDQVRFGDHEDLLGFTARSDRQSNCMRRR